MKKALQVVMPSAGPLREEDLHTYLVVAEGLLNSRPLAYVSTDPDDLSALPPAHFLMQKPYADSVPVTSSKSQSLAKRWFHVQETLDKLWQRFIREVVPHLNVMNSWTTKRRDLQVGDVVVVFEEKQRGVWPLGVIVETITNAQDGHARRAKVRCNGRELVRSLSRLLVVQEAEAFPLQ